MFEIQPCIQGEVNDFEGDGIRKFFIEFWDSNRKLNQIIWIKCSNPREISFDMVKKMVTSFRYKDNLPENECDMMTLIESTIFKHPKFIYRPHVFFLHLEYYKELKPLKRALPYIKDLNQIRENGQTPLQVLAGGDTLYGGLGGMKKKDSIENRIEKVRFLLQHGADVNAKVVSEDPNYPEEYESWTALHIAVEENRAEIVKLLIEAGADVNQLTAEYSERDQRYTWKSPLHLAVLNGNVKIAEILLKNGAYVDIFNEEQNTPLHLAAMNDDRPMIRLLLKYHADAFIENKYGVMPRTLASEEMKKNMRKSFIHH